MAVIENNPNTIRILQLQRTIKLDRVGIRGPTGPGAFEVWQAQAGNEDGTQADYLDWLANAQIEVVGPYLTGAEAARNAAVTAAGTALGAQTAAVAAKTTAEQKAADAEAARAASVTAKNASEAAKDLSIAAKDATIVLKTEVTALRDSTITYNNYAYSWSEQAHTYATAAAASATSADTRATASETARGQSVAAKVASEAARDAAAASQTAAAGSASTATTQAGLSATAKTGAESARDAAIAAKDATVILKTDVTTLHSSVVTYEDSAHTWATASAGSASAALASATTAITKAGESVAARDLSVAAKTASESARDTAVAAQTSASGSATTATTQASLAATSKTGADAAKDQALIYRNEAEAFRDQAEDIVGGDYLSETEANTLYRPLATLIPIDQLSGLAASITAAIAAQRDAANGLAPLDINSKVPTNNLPESILGAMKYQNTWNASTNSPAIPAAATGNRGWYYVVATAGTTTVDGVSEWAIGDWIVSNGTKWDKIDSSDQVTSVAGKTGVVTLVKGDVGLSNVDNTSDANKPVSTAQQTALNLKANASAVSNVDNTSDANKPVSTAQQTAINLKADSSALSDKLDKTGGGTIAGLLVINQGAITTAVSAQSITATYNNAAVTFPGVLVMNVTDTASNAASLLADFKVGGTSVARISKDGFVSAEGLRLASGGVNGVWYYNSLFMTNTTVMGWSSTFDSNGTKDLMLSRFGAGTLNIGGPDAASVTTQTIRVVGVTGVANTAGADLYFRAGAGTGTGQGGALTFQTAAAGGAGSTQNGYANAMVIDAAKNVTFYGNFAWPAGGIVAWSGRTLLQSQTDGNITITNNAGTGFGRMLLGPSGTTYTSLKHLGTGNLAVRLADDSNYARLSGADPTAAQDFVTKTYITPATVALLMGGTNDVRPVTAKTIADAHVYFALTDASTIAWDMTNGFKAKVTIAANRTMGAPTNPKEGYTYALRVKQDATGSRTVTWNSAFDWGSVGAPTLNTGANKEDMVFLECYDASTPKFAATFRKGA